MAGGASFEAVKAVALENIGTLAKKLLPHGKTQGHWWVSKCPWRDDQTPSLGISLTTGNWKDWGRAEGGTIIDLIMRLDNCDNKTALKTLAALLGITELTPRPKQEWKSCADCAYLWHRFPFADYCTRCVTPVDEEPRPIADARRNGGECGQHAKLYKAA